MTLSTQQESLLGAYEDWRIRCRINIKLLDLIVTHVGSYGYLSLHRHHPRSAISRQFTCAAPDINGKVTKLKEVSPLHYNVRLHHPRVKRENDVIMQHERRFPPWVGCLQRKPLLYISSWIDSNILSAEMVTTVAISASISFPSRRSQPYIMAPVDVTSTKWRRPRRNSLHFFVI